MRELKVTLRPLYCNRICATVMSLNVDITACPQVRPGCSSWRDCPTFGIVFTILILFFILGSTAYFRSLASIFPGFPDIWVFRAWGRQSHAHSHTWRARTSLFGRHLSQNLSGTTPTGHGRHRSFAQTVTSYGENCWLLSCVVWTQFNPTWFPWWYFTFTTT
jgi:hypothetical protein